MAQASSRGRFVCYELVTTDPAAAQPFYTDVIGWRTAVFGDAGIPYTMWLKGATPDTAVGGLMELPEEARKGGVSPHWIGYVAVPDVDATAAKVEELGGRVIMGPLDIPNVGRFVIFADPQGAVLAAYRSAQEMSSEDSEAEPGDFTWRELATTDHQSALAFYSRLFGWEKTQAMDMGDAGVYQMYGRAGRPLGGMYDKTAHGTPGPPAWLYYIRVADLDAAVRRVEENGGMVVDGPMDVPSARIAVCVDPQGAAFALHQLA